MVFQNYALYPHMTVADNIMFPLINRKVPKAEARERAQEMAKLVQLDHLMDRKPKALSGGQRQRISIARAIVKDAELLLFDEPTSALDYQTEINICKTIDEISKDRTVITVAHRLNTIRDYDRIYVLDRGEIVEQGTHSELMSMHGRYAHMYDEFINKEMRDRV